MKITDTRKKTPTAETTLNNIQEGQVFRGVLHSSTSGRLYTGVWYKANGGWRNTRADMRHDVVVVRLDRAGKCDQGFSNIVLNCMRVTEYEPLNVELVIH